MGKILEKNCLINLSKFKRNIRAIDLCMSMDVIFVRRMLIPIVSPTIVHCTSMFIFILDPVLGTCRETLSLSYFVWLTLLLFVGLQSS